MLKKRDVLTIYGSYNILEQVGSGGNGSVYKAKTRTMKLLR